MSFLEKIKSLAEKRYVNGSLVLLGIFTLLHILLQLIIGKDYNTPFVLFFLIYGLSEFAIHKMWLVIPKVYPFVNDVQLFCRLFVVTVFNAIILKLLFEI